jgi:YggT family protein
VRALSLSTGTEGGFGSGLAPENKGPPTGVRMLPLIKLVLTILDLYKIIIIAGAILSWLIAFGVVNIRNDIVRSVWNLFIALTEPFLKPIRNFLPNTGGIDISPIILLLAIMFIQWIIQDDIAPLFY